MRLTIWQSRFDNNDEAEYLAIAFWQQHWNFLPIAIWHLFVNRDLLLFIFGDVTPSFLQSCLTKTIKVTIWQSRFDNNVDTICQSRFDIDLPVANWRQLFVNRHFTPPFHHSRFDANYSSIAIWQLLFINRDLANNSCLLSVNRGFPPTIHQSQVDTNV